MQKKIAQLFHLFFGMAFHNQFVQKEKPFPPEFVLHERIGKTAVQRTEPEKSINILQVHSADVGRLVFVFYIGSLYKDIVVRHHLAYALRNTVDDGRYGEKKRIFVGIAERTVLKEILYEVVVF